MYESIRPDYYGPHRVIGVYNIAKNFIECSRMGTSLKRQRQPELFLPRGQLNLVAIDILGTTLRTKTGNWLAVVVMEQYSSLTTAIQNENITSTRVANILFHDGVFLYGITEKIRSESGQQFVSLLFMSLCTYSALKKLTTTAFH